MSFHELFEIHMKWKICFIQHIRRQRQLSAPLMQKILHETDCALDTWLASSVTLPVRDTEEFATACVMHTRFHDEMRRLAWLINYGRFQQAEVLLEPGSTYERTSMRLARALSAIGRLSHLRAASAT